MSDARPASIPALTSVRFFAAAQVVLLHFGDDLFHGAWVQRLVRGGYAAVSFFFVLSGFVLTYNYAGPLERGRLTHRSFWLSRFARIYPLYAAMVLVEVPIMRWVMDAPLVRLAPATIAHLAVVQSWLPPFVFVGNIPGWTIAVEALYYAVFPFVVTRWVTNAPRGRLVATIGGAWLLGMAVPAVQWVAPLSQDLIAIIRTFPAWRLHELVIGIATARIFLLDRAEGKTRPGSIIALPAAIAILLLTAEEARTPFLMIHNGLLAPLYAALLYGLAHGGSVARLISVRPLIVLGEASYALYLMQLPLFHLLGAAHVSVQKPSHRVAFFALLLGLSVVAHFRFELPMRRFLREKLAPRVTRDAPRDVRFFAIPALLLCALYPFAYPFWNRDPLGPVYGAQWRLGVDEGGFFKQEWDKLRPFRWTKELATLNIPVFDAVPRRVHFRLESHAPRGTDLRIVANGSVLFDGHVEKGPAVLALPLPPIGPGAPVLLEIHSSTFCPKRDVPGALDGRRLGIRVVGVQLE